MALFSFGKNSARSVALIDVSAGSVGGAFAHYAPGKLPSVCYAARVAVEPREGEKILDATLRSLAFLERLLIEVGAPLLRKATGDGSIEKVLVTIGAPWQETTVATTHIQKDRPFTITESLLESAAKELISETPEQTEAGHTVLATVLNGYDVTKPIGKRVTRADIVLLSSVINKEAEHAIPAALRRTFHTRAIETTSFAPVAYRTFQKLYPAQKDFVVVSVGDAGTEAAFVRHSVLTGVHTIPLGLNDLSDSVRNVSRELFAEQVVAAEAKWLSGLKELFTTFSSQHALPRTVFLFAESGARDFLKRMLEDSDLKTLWLSDEPLSIIPVLPAHFAASLNACPGAEGDLLLLMLALFEAEQGA